jgi:hypothetical protein
MHRTEGFAGIFHNKYIISTARNVSEPVTSGKIMDYYFFTGRAIFQQKRGAHDLQETRQRESRTVSGRLSQRGVTPEE